MAIKRLQIAITGVVQGVGFRPLVYRIANQLNLTGWVQNNAQGVLIEIQGRLSDKFVENLIESLPPLVQIETLITKAVSVQSNDAEFQIKTSESGCERAMISPDTGICKDCLTELFEPDSRYYLYPFLNCTQCGPRLTLTRNLPYDRAHTSMNEFPLCVDCLKDYQDTLSRRYHAQPTACKCCGPQLSVDFKTMADAIHDGKILAVKGLGGYQLICDAQNEAVVANLRRRKNRAAKPFALMVLNLNSAEQQVRLSAVGRDLLTAPARPIVLLTKKNHFLPDAIAPGLNELGIMLPSTPVHYLLLHALTGFPEDAAWLENIHPSVLIVTSANAGGNPLLIEDNKAQTELADIADLVVSYNRAIITRVDDSVLKIINGSPSFIRRARGYVPKAIKLKQEIPVTLALGAYLKNTFCITRGDEAFVSQHIGSLNNSETINFFHESLNHLQHFLNVKIERVAYDLHPDFYTSQLAQTYDCPHIPVQHHHAHLASVAAEYHLIEPTLGLALDGYGYGHDGQAWGGELMLLDNFNCQRLSSFYPLAMPGGDLAAREPWRMAASVLHSLGLQEEISIRFQEQPHAGALADLLDQQVQPWPLTSSCGRYFDAASAILGVNSISNYEGHAAQLLESLVTKPEIFAEGWQFENGYFNMLPTFMRLLEVDASTGANIFHGTLTAGLAEWVSMWCKQTSIHTVLLSGGCFLNHMLATGLTQALRQKGLNVYLPRQLPANDGGLSLGQAWVAGHNRI